MKRFLLAGAWRAWGGRGAERAWFRLWAGSLWWTESDEPPPVHELPGRPESGWRTCGQPLRIANEPIHGPLVTTRTKSRIGNIAAPAIIGLFIVLLLAGILLPSRRDLNGTHFRFHPVTAESERLQLLFGLIIHREREPAFNWYADHCAGRGHMPQDDPAWRSADGGTIYGMVRLHVQQMLAITEQYEVPPEDRCIAIRYLLDHPHATIWCQIGEDQQSLEWWADQEVAMRWEKGKGIKVLRK